MRKTLFLFVFNFMVLNTWAGDNIITFADANVKAICVANWDTNGDGELSYDEAAAVTSIGGVFTGNSEITSFDELQYFTGVSEIPGMAFAWSYNLHSIILPHNINTIGYCAFEQCNSLSSISFPSSLEKITESAFNNCTSLTSVTIPQTILEIGWNPFNGCHGLTSIVVEDGNPNYDSRENCNAIMETATNKLISGCKYTIIPEETVEIGSYAFFGVGFNYIPFSENLTTIRHHAFSFSKGSTLTIPANVTTIESSAFEGCEELTTITIDENNPIYDSRENCNALIATNSNTLITGCINTNIPNSVERIDPWAFTGDILSSVILPAGIISIEGSPFGEGSNLESVTIKRTEPISISSATFPHRSNATLYVPAGCKAAYEAAEYWNEFKEIVEMGAQSSNITFADANVKAICVANWDTDGDGELSYDEAAAVEELGEAFKENTEITSFDELQYFMGITAIRDRAFNGCSALTSITIPNCISSIEGAAFWGCSGLTSIEIPSSVTSIGDSAFAGCWNLSSVLFNNGLKTIGQGAFSDLDKLTSVTLPESVTFIAAYSFAWNDNLTTVTINSNSILIEPGAFADYNDHIETAYINGIIAGSPASAFHARTTIIYGENGGYAYADMDMDYLNTDDNIIDKGFLANTENFLITIPIYLRNNNANISQIQFDLRIAPDFSLAENPNGRKMIEMDKTRFDYDEDFGYSHTMTLTEFGEGHYRVVLTSPENTPLKASDDDAFLYVTLHLNEGIKEGDINMLSIEGIEFSTPSADKIRPGNIGKNVKVYLREPGDFNHDNVVSVTDYAGVVKWVAGQGYDDQGVPEWVIKKASDVNEDGDISVTDVSGIANIILYGNYTGHASNVKARRMAKKQGASLSIEPFSISPDETKEITVNLSSSDAELSQCQFDITLPEGMSVASVNGRPAVYPGSIIRTADGFSHAVSCALREDGTVRVVCLSGSNDAYNRTEGCLVRMKVIADKDIAAGSADIEISNVEFARTDASKVWGAGGIASVTIGHETDGISSIADSSAALKEIYSADGTRKNRLTKGMNIIRHTDGSVQKVMVK